MSDSTDIEREILRLAKARGDASFCPSEVARRCATGPGDDAWRSLMPMVRLVAAGLALEGRLVATQGGRIVDAGNAQGPIRLRKAD